MALFLQDAIIASENICDQTSDFLHFPLPLSRCLLRNCHKARNIDICWRTRPCEGSVFRSEVTLTQFTASNLLQAVQF